MRSFDLSQHIYNVAKTLSNIKPFHVVEVVEELTKIKVPRNKFLLFVTPGPETFDAPYDGNGLQEGDVSATLYFYDKRKGSAQRNDSVSDLSKVSEDLRSAIKASAAAFPILFTGGTPLPVLTEDNPIASVYWTDNYTATARIR